MTSPSNRSLFLRYWKLLLPLVLALIPLLLADVPLGAVRAVAEETNASYLSDSATTWVGVDGLGRILPAYETTGGVREGKYVGLFFHTWHSTRLHANHAAGNVTEILEANPGLDVTDYQNPAWGDYDVYFWDEPIWGYYRSDDEWVLRKQAELLANAQIDVVFFDTTNYGETFLNEAFTLLRVWSEARKDGVKTPAVSFMLPMFEFDYTADQLRTLYKELYGKGLYSDMWFYWKGKPLILAYPGKLDQTSAKDREILNFFQYRPINHRQSTDGILVKSHSGSVIRGDNSLFLKDGYQLWNWICTYPQIINRNPDGTPEEMAVSVAHNWCKETHLTAFSNQIDTVYSRDYIPSEERYDIRENAVSYGAYFADEWEYALSVDPEFIFITGWNEWTAGRYETYWDVTNALIDQFTDARSRDIEPTKGVIKDHYYYQMVSYIRRFKGCAEPPVSTGSKTVTSLSEIPWDTVGPIFSAYPNNISPRNAPGYRGYTYVNRSGRNDIVESRVTYDADYVYFMVKTANMLTPSSDPAWMRLFFTVKEGEPNWESFSYVVNRVAPSRTKTLLERSRGGWDWEAAAEVSYEIHDNVLVIAIPRDAVGLSESVPFTLRFKWNDHMYNDGDVMDFYSYGDTAPGGRFCYLFTSAPGDNGPRALWIPETEPAVTDFPAASEPATAETPVSSAPTETAPISETQPEPVTTGEAVTPNTRRRTVLAASLTAVGVAAVGTAALIAMKEKHGSR